MNNSDQIIKTDNPFTEQERLILGKLANAIIPASEQYKLPGAGEEAILATMLIKAKRNESLLKKGLSDLLQFAKDQHKILDALTDDELLSLLDEFEKNHQPFAESLMVITAQSYYQDERVLVSLDMEARPPFPKGHEVQQGDWSLLEPVKQKEKLYREV